MNYLTSLPYDLHYVIFHFLSYREKISIISCNTSIHRFYFQKERLIQLEGENTKKFFFDLDFQEMILEKINNPLNQLILHAKNSLFDSFHHDFHMHRLNGIKTLALPLNVYMKLNESYPDCIPVVQNLHLWRKKVSDRMECERMIPFLHRVTKSLQFFDFQNQLQELSLPSRIEELCFYDCKITKLSSPLPNLRVLVLFHSCISNLNDFKYLDVLRVDQAQLSVMNDYAALSTAKKLNIEYYESLYDNYEVSFLQENEDITIFGCGNLVNFTNCFSKSKRITIDISYESIDVDVSYYLKAEQLKLAGRELVLTHGLARGNIPYLLRKLYLEGVRGFTNLIGFEHLTKISLLNCPLVTTLRGLVRVPFVHVQGLVITSIEGLGENRVVWIECCDNVKDFSPLKYVNRVTVVDCEGFRDSCDLDHVSHVTIYFCEQLEDVTGFKDADSVELSCCSMIRSVEVLQDVKKVRVERCHYLEDRNVNGFTNLFVTPF